MRPGHQKAARVRVFEHGYGLYLGGAVRDGMHGLVAQLAASFAMDDERPESAVHETVAILIANLH
jgi:hypothetical protein